MFILGLVFGSFISALSYRYPRKITITKGRSFCPNCRHQIAWYDNVPLLSFVFLGGRCRSCKKPISLRYPAIELATALGFLLIGPNIFNLVIFCVLELIFLIDLEHQIIPDMFIFFGIVVSILFALITGPQSLFTSFFSGLLGASILLLIHLATRSRGMGLGDVKFAILGGMLVGLRLDLIWLFLAFLTGGLAGIILILGRRAGLKDKIAFGPFLVIAIPIALVWGERMLHLLWLN